MHRATLLFLSLATTSTAAAQAPGHFLPDSLVNTQVFPHNTPVSQVVSTMRGITAALDVRCDFCHEEKAGPPSAGLDFPSDKKQTKLIARQMLRMVAEINRRVDTLPGHATGDPVVTCATCHRGVTLPVPLSQLMQEAAEQSTDSAVRAYRALRQRYYGRASYDFGEESLNTTASQLARGGKFTEALAMLSLNEESFPTSAGIADARGDVQLMKGDTAAAVAAFREAQKRDPDDREARGRLHQLGQKP